MDSATGDAESIRQTSPGFQSGGTIAQLYGRPVGTREPTFAPTFAASLQDAFFCDNRFPGLKSGAPMLDAFSILLSSETAFRKPDWVKQQTLQLRSVSRSNNVAQRSVPQRTENEAAESVA